MTKDTCKKCGRKSYIVNKHYNLCQDCNRDRLQVNKPIISKVKYIDIVKEKQPLKKLILKKREPAKKSLFKPELPNKKSTKEKIKDDEIFYLKCFKKSNHKCEECNVQLPEQFEDDNGKVIGRWRYSHIVPKSIAPHLRHDVDNINNLCLPCHSRWENEDKENMRIFEKNVLKYPEYLSKFLKNCK